jgi:hypothetical protein
MIDGNPEFVFHTVAGRWTVLLLFDSAGRENVRAALRVVARNRDLLDDDRGSFFGVTTDPEDVAKRRIVKQLPGIRWFTDHDRAVSRLYGAADGNGDEARYRPYWLLLDPMQRIRSVAPLAEGERIFAELRGIVEAPPEVATAPVLVVPKILPPELCRHLISLYEEHGGMDSGFMREENGITVPTIDYGHKRRSDHKIKDEDLIARLKHHLGMSLIPMMKLAFQFEATRIERFNVACYDSETGGHFRAHRDNTTMGTAHRRFACTINLNAEEYEGGDIRFPEFGMQTYRAPTGGAVVFSCSMLHEVVPMTKGRRYAFLPFFYDEEGARVREANLSHVAPHLQSYRSGLTPAPVETEREAG